MNLLTSKMVALVSLCVVAIALLHFYPQRSQEKRYQSQTTEENGAGNNQAPRGGVTFYNSGSQINQATNQEPIENNSGDNQQGGSSSEEPFVYQSPIVPGSNSSPFLDVPFPSDAELSIKSDGVSDLAGYVQYVENHAKDMKFDFQRLVPYIPPRGSGRAPDISVSGVIEEALKNGTSSETEGKIVVVKDFVTASTAYKLSIGVTSVAKETNRVNIGLDRLGIRAIEQYEKFSRGTISQSELQEYHDKYKVTLASHARDMLGVSNEVGKNDNFTRLVRNAGSILGIDKVAHATTLGGYGGTLSLVEPCFCVTPPQIGFVVTVGPPVPAISFVSLLYTNITLSSKPVPPVQALGTTIPVPGECFVQTGYTCAPYTDYPSTSLIFGTS